MNRTARLGCVTAGRGRPFLAMVLAATALVVVGCGSSDRSSVEEEGGQQEETANASGAGEETTAATPPATPTEAVRAAYGKTAGAKTAKVDMTTAFSGLPGGTNLDTSGRGVVDFENRSASLVMSTPSGAEQTEEVEVRQIGGVVYQGVPEALRARLSGGKPWLRNDLDETMRGQPGAASTQGNAPANDPAQWLAYLEDVSDPAEEVGEEEVRGEPTTHYRAAVDLEKAAEEQYSTEARLAREFQQQLGGAAEVPVDVWLDGEGLVRRYEVTASAPVPEAAKAGFPGGEVQTTMVQEFYDFGTPVSIEAPPEDQVTDLEELFGPPSSGSEPPDPR